MSQTNDHLVLLVGKSATGKSASLLNLEKPEGVMYLNCENGKKLPFKSKFMQLTVTDPYQLFEAFQVAESKPEIHTIVIDSLTYLLDMFESMYVYKAANGQQAWSDFQQYFKTLMQTHVAGSSKRVIFTAHVDESLNKGEMIMETKVPVKGALKTNGIESYFTVVIAAKKVPLKDLAEYKNDLLVITAEEEALGFKHVFQTKITKDTVHERLRGPLGLWSNNETFIDNDMQKVLNRLHDYYTE